MGRSEPVSVVIVDNLLPKDRLFMTISVKIVHLTTLDDEIPLHRYRHSIPLSFIPLVIMHKEIRQISEDGKIVRITVCDERWYIKTLEDGSIKEYPSSTWISGFCPMGIGYYKWLANQGWDNAQSIMTKAGNKGTKIHKGIHSLVLGNEVRMNEKFPNDEGEPEELTLEEYEAILSFAEWFKETKPEVLASEIVVFNDEYGYAGTLDLICKIENEVWLIDYKSSAEIYPSHEAQISSYKNSDTGFKIDKLGILQVGYKRNKNKKWKFTEISDQFDMFLAAKRFWQKECEDMKIFVKDYPTSITLS